MIAFQTLDFAHVQPVIVACIVVGACTGVLFFTLILASRMLKTRRQRKTTLLREHLQKSLNAFMLHDSGGSARAFPWAFHLRALRSLLVNRWSRQVMIDVLIANQQNLSGRPAAVLRKVYLRLGLRRVSRAKLRHRNDHVKIEGLQELAAMQCTDALDAIGALLRHPSRQVREESFVALVRLDDRKSFDLVLAYNGRISSWMRMVLHQHLRQQGAQQLPPFYRWLESHNTAVRKFALDMIMAFQQLEAVPMLLALLHDADREVAILSAAALGELGVSDTAEAVMAFGQRHLTDSEVSLAVVRALRQLSTDPRHASYLAWQLTHGSPWVRAEALRALQAMPVNLLDMRLDFNPDNDRDFDDLYAHVTHPLLP